MYVGMYMAWACRIKRQTQRIFILCSLCFCFWQKISKQRNSLFSSSSSFHFSSSSLCAGLSRKIENKKRKKKENCEQNKIPKKTNVYIHNTYIMYKWVYVHTYIHTYVCMFLQC